MIFLTVYMLIGYLICLIVKSVYAKINKKEFFMFEPSDSTHYRKTGEYEEFDLMNARIKTYSIFILFWSFITIFFIIYYLIIYFHIFCKVTVKKLVNLFYKIYQKMTKIRTIQGE